MRSLALCALALVASCIATPPPPRPGGPADPAALEGPVAPAPAALQPVDGGTPAERRKKQDQGPGDTQADGGIR
jgi:hypothetical protein